MMMDRQREVRRLRRALGMDGDPGHRRVLDAAIKRNLSLAHDAPPEEVESRLAVMTFEERTDLLAALEQELFAPVT